MTLLRAPFGVILAVSILFLLSGMDPVYAQARPGVYYGQLPPDPGLKVDSDTPIKVEVDLLQTNELGLTEKYVRNMSYQRLREAQIPTLPDSSSRPSNTLFVNLEVTRDTVAVTIAFAKLTPTTVGQQQFMRKATTWTSSFQGLHRNSLDIVLAGFRNALDHFVSEYLRANVRQAGASGE